MKHHRKNPLLVTEIWFQNMCLKCIKQYKSLYEFNNNSTSEIQY